MKPPDPFFKKQPHPGLFFYALSPLHRGWCRGVPKSTKRRVYEE